MMKKFLRIFVIASLLYLPAISIAKTHVLLTVDVESFNNGDPKTNIWGIIDGYEGKNGVPRILEVLEKNESKATFYLNVYEIAKHGEEDVRLIAQQIVSKGQDLQLHTHPKPMYGKSGMSQFSLNQQEEILIKGKELIFEWTGKNVIAHRAGAYLGNTDTLKALKRTGLFIDSSLSPATSSPLFREGYKENDIIQINNILQIPITYYTQLKFMNWESTRFLDIESSSLDELKEVLNQMAEQGSCAANIMMHSFSITRDGFPDDRIIHKMDALLEYVKEHPGLVASSTTSFYEAYNGNNLSCKATPDFIPHTGIISTYVRSWKRFNDGWKNVVVALSVPVSLIIIAMIVQLIRLTRRSRAHP